MKCASCASENPASSRFCAQCGAQLKETARCEACGRAFPAGAQYCPGCGFNLVRAAMIVASESFEHELYRQSRGAFYGRFVERAERKSAESSLYGVIRLLAKRPIELDMAAAHNDLAGILAEMARPYVASLRRREVLVDLSTLLSGVSGEVQLQLERLDAVSRAAAAELVDHPLSRASSAGAAASFPSTRNIWPGIGGYIGPAVETDRITGLHASEHELLDRLNHTFHEFVAAYDRLWLPLFNFIERYMAEKCHLMWRRLSSFELDFRRYAARILDCQNRAGDQLLEDALAAARLASAAGPDEPLAPLLEGHLLYRLGRREEALAAFESAAELQLPFVGLEAERYFWSGRCLFDDERYDEAIETFEALIALAKQQVEARYFMEGEFLLAHCHLLRGDVESGSRRLLSAIGGGYSEVAGLLDDPRLATLRGREDFRATLRSATFLQALGRQAGIHPRGSTYLSRGAAALRLATAPGSWLELREGEDLVFFYDAGRTGSGRSGLCLTDRRLLYRAAGGRAQSVALAELASLSLADGELVLNGKLVLSDLVFDRLPALHQLLSLVRKIFAD